MPKHSSLTAHADLHRIGVIQSADPGAIGAGKVWIDSDDNAVRIRNADDSGWIGPLGTFAGGTFTGDISVPDEAYDATTWNGSLEVPTKNAVRDKIESLSSGSGGSYVLLESHTASASAQLDFGTRNATGQSGALVQSDCDEYVFRFVNVRPATDAVDLQMRMSVSGSFVTTNSYTWTKETNSASSVAVASSAGSVSFIQLGNSWNTTASWSINGSIVVSHPGSSIFTPVEGTLTGLNASARFRWGLMGFFESTSVVDGFRFFFSSGNVASGTILCYGIKNS